MDMRKLCEIITHREDLQDVPIIYIFRVAYAVFDVINSGACFWEREEI